MKVKTSNLGSNGLIITNANDKANFNRYLNEVRNLAPLSREEEIEIFKRVEENDQEAINKVAAHNLRFVITIAKHYSTAIATSSLTLEDLVSEGNLGMMEAIKRFNYREGNKFISYAVWWIKQGILSCIQYNVKSIRIPGNARQEITQMKKQELILSKELGRSVKIDRDLLYKTKHIMQMSGFEGSIDINISDDNNSTQINQSLLCPDDLADTQLIAKERKDLILGLILKSPQRTQEFIKLYYGIDTKPITYQAIGDMYHLTSETVRQSINKALRRIRYNNRTNAKYFHVEY